MNNTEKLMLEYQKMLHSAYHKKVLPLLLKFKVQQKKYLCLMWFWIIMTIIATATADFYFKTIARDISGLLLLVNILALMAISGIISHHNSKFVKELKSHCLRPILQIFGNIQWKTDVLPNEILQQSELFSIFNRWIKDDGFYGEYKGVKFEISELALFQQNGSGKYKTIVEVFDGVIIKFTSNKSTNGKTIITTKGDSKIKNSILASCFASMVFLSLFVFIPAIITNPELFKELIPKIILLIIPISWTISLLYMSYKKKKERKVLKQIHLEDPEFEKKFNAYSIDEIEGRYLITTAFMERFLNLKTAFGAKNAKCAFFDDCIIFAISTPKNLFEIGNLFTKIENSKQITTFFNEFASILLLIDYFKLNEKTGL